MSLMRKLLVNRTPLRNQAWGGGNLFVTALCDIAPKHGLQVVHQLEPGIDIIFLMDPRPGNTGVSINEAFSYKQCQGMLSASGVPVKIVHRVNECDARKGTNDVDHMLRLTSKCVDDTVFVSNWMKDYHVAHSDYAGGCHHVIYNGVDASHFRPNDTQPVENKVKIVAHHWSDNPLKGQDVYEAIDKLVGKKPDSFEFTYIGRHKCRFNNTRVIPPLFGQTLGDELRKHNVYVSGSRFDPGPNHIIESISCGLPTYVHADGGGAVEFAGKSHVYDSIDDLEKILLSKAFAPNENKFDSWECVVDRYMSVILNGISV